MKPNLFLSNLVSIKNFTGVSTEPNYSMIKVNSTLRKSKINSHILVTLSDNKVLSL